MSSPTPSRRGVPRRRQPVSALRRATRAVLVAGTVIALAAAFGPVWAVRIGLAVAVAAAVAAAMLAWRELTAERRAHAVAMAAASRAHTEQLHAERESNAAVVDTLGARSRGLAARIEIQQRSANQLGADLAAARGDCARLARDVARRDNQIGTLRRTIREQAAELDDLRGRPAEATGLDQRDEQPTPDAEVRVLPRRVRINDPAPAVPELTDRRPRTRELSATEQILMPNYEGELRFA